VRALALALLALALLAVPAGAATTTTQRTLPGGIVRPADPERLPPGWARSAEQVLRITDALPVVRAERARAPGSTREAFLKGSRSRRWQVGYYDERGGRRREIAQVHVDDATGAVLEQWTGFRVAWTMARGYPGAFGRAANAPWVWIPLAVLFVVPFVDLGRPRRMLHADLAVLSAFSVAWALFNAGEIELSTPLVYPLLGYLLVRMLVVGLRRRGAEQRAREPLPLLIPTAWLAVALVLLVAGRVVLNVVDSNVIDVGYASVIGADRLIDGERLYGAFPQDNQHGDTYGPAAYAAYVPFTLALGFGGSWDDLPAAHAGAIAFDLVAIVLLFLVGRRLRGPRLGIVLAYAWAAFPFTLLVSSTNTNDALVAVCVLAALLAAASAPARGALVGLAGLTKFAPLALAPLFAAHGRARGLPAYVAGLAAALAAGAAVVLTAGGPSAFWDATLAFQADRDTPFSVYGLWGGLDAARTLVQFAAVVLAVVVAVVPRRDDLVGLAALGAAVLIALQLGATYWFFLYLAWFFPLVMVALLGRHAQPAR
jgi:hypothetical protein